MLESHVARWKARSTATCAPLGCGALRSLIAGLAMWSIALAGCHLPCGAGGVTEDVLTCRELTQQGIRSLAQGDYPRAELVLAQAVETCPIDADARRHRAEALWHRGQHDRALEEIVESIRLAENVDVLVRYGQMRLDLGQVELARQAAQRAVALDPHSGSAYALRARVMDRMGDTRRALADYHGALAGELPPSSAHLELADLYMRLGRHQRAAANAQNYLESNPEEEHARRAHYLAGMAYLSQNRAVDAVESLTLAAVRGSVEPEIMARLAEAHWRAGQPEQAREILAQSLRSAPGHRPSLALLSRMGAPLGSPQGTYHR